MKLLLDTHVWLWMQAAPGRLQDSTVSLIQDTGNILLLSAASAWEIAIKAALKRLALPAPPADYVASRMAQSGTTGLPIELRHALHVTTLPMHHRDPFDRLLVAQAQLESATLATADPQMNAYDVARIEA